MLKPLNVERASQRVQKILSVQDGKVTQPVSKSQPSSQTSQSKPQDSPIAPPRTKHLQHKSDEVQKGIQSGQVGGLMYSYKIKIVHCER